MPTADAYLLFTHVMIVVAISIVFYLVVSSKQVVWLRIVLCGSISSFAYLLNIWGNNYTIQAALFAAIGAVLLLSVVERFGFWKGFAGIFFLCLGYMWRIEGFLLIIPFVMLQVLADIYSCSNRKSHFKSLLKTVWPLLFFLFILSIIRSIINNSAQYAPSIAYSMARTVIQDYPILPYSEVKELIPNISEIQYNSAKNWVLIDTDNLNTELFTIMGGAASTTAYSFSLGGIVHALRDIFVVAWQHKLIMGSVGAFFFLSICCVIFSNKRKLVALNVILITLYVIGTGLILLYFTIKGRAPLHVWYSVLIISMVMTGRIVATGSYSRFSRQQWIMICAACLVIVACVAIRLLNSNIRVPQFAVNCRINNCAEKFDMTYTEDESVFIWGAWHKEVTNYYMSLGKLPSEDFMKHNISAGDWTYGQYYFVDYLEKLSITNPAKALINREKTYLVDEDSSFVLEYLKATYGENICAIQVDSICEIPVWQFIKYD